MTRRRLTTAKAADATRAAVAGRESQGDPSLARVRAEAEAVDPTKTIGGPGFATIGGYLQSREKDPDLQGSRRYVTYGEIESNVEVVATGVEFTLDLATRPDIIVESADDSSEAAEVAEFVEDVLADTATPLRRVRRRAAMFKFYGYSVHEWTAKRRKDGRIGVLDVEVRPQSTIERWDVDQYGVVVGIVQRSPNDLRERYLPRSKVLHFVDDALSDSPEGFGAFRSIVSTARRLQRYEEIEGVGFDTDLRGIPLCRAPIGELQKLVNLKQITQAQADDAIGVLKKFMDGHVRAKELALMLDSDVYRSLDGPSSPSGIYKWAMELIQGGSTSLEAMNTAIERLQRSIARRLGIMSFMLGGTGGGAFALSEDQSRSFALKVDSTIAETLHTIDVDLVRPVLALNGINDDLRPTLKAKSVQHRTVQELAAVFRDLATAGVPLSERDEAVGELFDLIGFTRPIVDPDRDAVDESLLPGRRGVPFGGNGNGASGAEGAGDTMPPAAREPQRNGKEA